MQGSEVMGEQICISFACYLHTTPCLLSLSEPVAHVAAKGWLR